MIQQQYDSDGSQYPNIWTGTCIFVKVNAVLQIIKPHRWYDIGSRLLPVHQQGNLNQSQTDTLPDDNMWKTTNYEKHIKKSNNITTHSLESVMESPTIMVIAIFFWSWVNWFKETLALKKYMINKNSFQNYGIWVILL